MFIKTIFGAASAFLAVASTSFAGDITIGTAPNLQTLPIVVAQSEGYFTEEGINLETVKFTSGRRALEALIGGQLDVAFMAEYPVSIAALRDQPFGTFTTLSRYTANRMISKGSIGFEDPSSLMGKKIGTTKGSNTEFFTEALLEKFGVDAEVINVSPPDIVPALARGDIDAGIMFPDFYPAAEKALGDDYREFRSDAYVAWFVLSATPEMLNDRPEELAGFVRALIKAEDFIKANPDGAMAALETASEGLLSMGTIKTKFAEAEYEIGLANGLLDILEVQANWVVEKGMVEAEPTRESIKEYLATGPLEMVDASRISLD
ncbi:MAG: ABC transporter substrate-binding protein [Paracoccaceae bacterium]|nr:ABC transporter substrate-binding protein [Paracoccaceae bacterium]